MRTATKFIEGKDVDEFVDVVKNYYPAGKTAIIAQDREEGEKLARKLGKDYTVELFSPQEEIVTGARFFIGVGGSGVIPAVKRAAKSEKYAFIPAVFDYRFFYAADGIRTVPEFVFLTEETRSERKEFCLRLYVTVFQLYAECAFRAFYASAYPYRDRESETFCRTAEKFLKGEENKEEYCSAGLRWVSSFLNAAFREGETFATEKCAERYGVTSGERFIVSYFLILLLKNFTKHPFRAILLPSERAEECEKTVCAEAFDERLLPTDETLTLVRKKVRFLTEMPAADIGKLLDVAKEYADEPIFTILREEGIIEALRYERSERHHGLLV